MTTVSNGQTSGVSSGSTSGGWIVLAGGTLNVLSGGVISGAVDSGGFDVVSAGGLALSTTISSGGTQYDYGSASGTIVSSGGFEYVVSGGTAASTTISGGTLEVTSGANGGNVTFASGGILQLDSLVAFGGTISGFHLGDDIDLRGLAFTSGTTNLSWTQLTSGANASGTLTVSSGAAVETLTLLGQYTAANFSATSDGAGGTLITDPPASSSAIQTPLVAHH